MGSILKSLGVALIAMLALSAAMSSTANAAPKWTPAPEGYPVTWRANQVGTMVLALEGGRKIECSTVTFEGVVGNKSEAEESTLTATPTYSGCTATILGNVDLATVTVNGCHFKFAQETTTSGIIAAEGWEVTGGLRVVGCPSGHRIEIHVFTTEAKDQENKPLCTYTIEEQISPGWLTYKLTEKNAEGIGTSGAIRSRGTQLTTVKSAGTETNCGWEMQFPTLEGETKVEWFGSKGEMVRGKFED